MLKEIKNLPTIDDIIPTEGACIVILDNCQNDDKKLYLDRIENKVDIKVVTAFVTIHLDNNNCQHIDNPLWSQDNLWDETLIQKMKDAEAIGSETFKQEQKKFIESFINPNGFQLREEQFIQRCIDSNEIDASGDKDNLRIYK
jgi:hypothetical protein